MLQKGMGIWGIARELGIARNTVRRYLNAPEPMRPKPRRQRSSTGIVSFPTRIEAILPYIPVVIEEELDGDQEEGIVGQWPGADRDSSPLVSDEAVGATPRAEGEEPEEGKSEEEE